jgi:hypothetical protein
MEFDSLFFRLLKIKPEYNDLHTFECVCFVDLPPFKRHELEAQFAQCTFVGLSNYEVNLGPIV